MAPGRDSADEGESLQPIKRISSEVIMSELTKMSLGNADGNHVPSASRVREGSMERGLWSMDESVGHEDEIERE